MGPKRFRRVTAWIGLLAMTVGLSTGCAPDAGDAARIRVETPLSDKGAVLDLADTARGGVFAATAEEQQALSRMTLQVENTCLALYTGTYTDIAVLDKETGHIWFSNPAVYELHRPGTVISEESTAFSPLKLEYYDGSYRSSITTMYVYGDCINDTGMNQAALTVTGDTLRIDYVLGQRQEDMLYFAAMTPETFRRVNAQLEAAADADDPVITYSEWGLFEKSYEEPEYNGTDAYVLYSTVSTLELNRLSALMRKLGITAEEIAAEEKRAGIEKPEVKTAWFSIPVVYRLQGRDLLASVDYQDIECAGKYRLSRISLLENLGAAEQGTPGWIFVPNGSGMLIENDRSGGDMSEISLSFYGTDYGRILSTSAELTPANTLPVFGVKGGDCALFGIVESGDAGAGLVAAIANSESPYNRVYPYFDYYSYDDAGAGVSTELTTRKVFSKTTPDTVFRVRYHFLYGDTADYSGMAAYYRTYLVQTGGLNRQKEAAPLMTVELLGSIRKKSTSLGIPLMVHEPLTTFDQAAQILSELAEQGVDDPDVVLSGIFNGGLDHKLNDRAKLQRELGGRQGYLSLQQSLESRNLTVFAAASPLLVYQGGNGYSAASQTARNLEKKYASLAPYDPSTDRRGTGRLAYLVSPLYYADVMKEFLSSFSSLGGSLYLTDLGSCLISDFNERREIHREQSKHYAAETVKAAADACEKLVLDGGNAYVLPYADRLINVELTSEGYEIQSKSIPFVQMVLHGYVPYSGGALNMESDQTASLLKAVETGAGLYYRLMYEDNTILLNTQFTSLYSTNYALWISRMAEQQKELSELYRSVSLCCITRHDWITDEVTCTVYDNGTRVLVNYGRTDYVADGMTVAAGGYTVCR